MFMVLRIFLFKLNYVKKLSAHYNYTLTSGNIITNYNYLTYRLLNNY